MGKSVKLIGIFSADKAETLYKVEIGALRENGNIEHTALFYHFTGEIIAVYIYGYSVWRICKKRRRIYYTAVVFFTVLRCENEKTVRKLEKRFFVDRNIAVIFGILLFLFKVRGDLVYKRLYIGILRFF